MIDTLYSIVWFLGGIVVGMLTAWFWMLRREDMMLESLISVMDEDVVQAWIKEQEDMRGFNK